MAHVVIYSYRTEGTGSRGYRLIQALAVKQGYKPQVVLDWMTSQAAYFTSRYPSIIDELDTNDLEVLIHCCMKDHIWCQYA